MQCRDVTNSTKFKFPLWSLSNVVKIRFETLSTLSEGRIRPNISSTLHLSRVPSDKTQSNKNSFSRTVKLFDWSVCNEIPEDTDLWTVDASLRCPPWSSWCWSPGTPRPPARAWRPPSCSSCWWARPSTSTWTSCRRAPPQFLELTETWC